MAAPINHTSLVEHKTSHFLITDRPTDVTISDYLKLLKQNNVVALVRVCEPSYDAQPIIDAGITVHDLAFDDGDPPPAHVIDGWLKITTEVFARNDDSRIAVHCVAGLGRAPVMVALTLIEAGMTPEDAAIFIREKRRGSINSKQLVFLRNYKRRSKPSSGGKCAIM